MRGKTRFARHLLGRFRHLAAAQLTDRYGNSIFCPQMREPIALALFADGLYEADTIRFILRHLPVLGSGVFLDVGANIGAIALPIARARPNVQVICVEADPGMAAILRRNIAENRLTNVIVSQSLAGAHAEASVPFYSPPPEKFGMGSIGPQFNSPPLLLDQVALDDLLDELEVAGVDVVKLDIEGAEYGALRGLTRRLTGGSPPCVLFEFADWAEGRIPGQEPGSAQMFLQSLGYRTFQLMQGGMEGPLPDAPLRKGSAMLVSFPGETEFSAKPCAALNISVAT